jgi:hypothetical protein
MDKEQRRAAKVQLVTGMQAGQPWQTAAAKAGLPIGQSSAYRLWGAFRQHGERALSDGRHGHPRAPVKKSGRLGVLDLSKQAGNEMQIMHHCAATQIKEIFAETSIASTPSLPVSDMRQRMFHRHPLP